MQRRYSWASVMIFGILLAFSTLTFTDPEHPDDVKKGPHGGRLLIDDSIEVEITLFEREMPPHFRAYLTDNQKSISPKQATLTLDLKRFDGERELITFEALENFMQSAEVIREPHSFDVNVNLDYQGKLHHWNYSTYEGRLKIVPEVAKAANIQVAVAASRVLEKKLSVVGKITPNRDNLAPVYPRYSGIIKAMTKNLGDPVEKGALLLTIESNESLQNYSINAPITGTVVKKRATTGELAKSDTAIYEIANLDTVWVDLALYRQESPLVKKGMKITVTGDEGSPKSASTISYISPLGVEDSQTTLARAVLSNQNQEWLPGMYVNVDITIEEKKVDVAIPLSALQRWRDWDVVFVQQGDHYEATPVNLGMQNNHWAEVTSGLKPGQQYVTENSFFLKADLGKSGASHDH